MSDYKYRNLKGFIYECSKCKYDDRDWYEEPCYQCCEVYCAFERKEAVKTHTGEIND